MATMWFDNKIWWLTAPAVWNQFSKWFEKTQLSNFPIEAKQKIATDVTNKGKPKLSANAPRLASTSPTIVWRLNPTSSEDKYLIALAADLKLWNKTGDVLNNDYLGKISAQSLSWFQSLINDFKNGSWADEAINAYPEFNPKVIQDAHTIINTDINTPMGKLWSNLKEWWKQAWIWVLSQLTNMAGNLISTSSQGQNLWINPIKIIADLYEWKNPIQEYVRWIMWEDEKTKMINQLTKEAQSEIVDHLWWDKDTIWFKVWQIVAEIAPFFAVPALWWEALWAKTISKLNQSLSKEFVSSFPKLSKLLKNQTFQNILQKTVTSIPSSEASSILNQGRPATPVELWQWAILQNVLPINKDIKKTEKLFSNIGEQTTDKNIQLAADMWNLRPQQSWLRKWWTWWRDVVKPSERTKAAVQTIKDEIKWFSTEPTKLLSQIKQWVKDLSNKISTKLQDIDATDMTQEKAEMINAINKTIIDAEEYMVTSWKKQVELLVDKIANGWKMTLDEIWKINKQINKQIPSNIRKWVWLKDKQLLVYETWKKGQDALNKYMHKLAESNWYKDSVKDFSKLSALLHWKWQLRENMPKLLEKWYGMLPRIKWLTKSWIKLYVLWRILTAWWTEKIWVAE